MRDTNALEKLGASVINCAIVALFSVPFLFIKTKLDIKYIIIIIFFLYQVLILFRKDKRCIGMIILKTYWNKEYKNINYIIFCFLYTLSFSTILIWVLIPFDLLLINLIGIQLPFVYCTGFTLHGFLSGKMKTVKKLKQ